MLNFKPLFEAKSKWVWLDLFMIWLVIVNLGWIAFDSLFAITLINDWLAGLFGKEVVAWYDSNVHANFFWIDLCFIAVFLIEFVIRWIVSLQQDEHDHWAVYPLVHWYDLLGCIPVGQLRWLRLLRVIAVLYRLNRLGVIRLNDWRIVRFGKRIYEIVMEELSDRVVVRVLAGVQEEVRFGQGMEKRVIEDILQPRKEQLIEGIAGSVADTVQSAYGKNRDEVQAFIKERISKAMRDNIEIKTIDRIPLLGGFASGRLDHAVNDIVCGVIDELIAALDSDEFNHMFGNIADAAFDGLLNAPDTEALRDRATIQEAIIDILEIVKEQVAQRRWAIKEEA